MNKQLILIFLIAQFALNIKAQDAKKLEKELEHREVVVKEKDSLIRCQVLVHDKEINPSKTESYYWFDNNKVHVNVGSFSGKLLDGEYTVNNQEGNLITKGEFKNGQKNGKWLSWSENGKIKSSSHWTGGKISGKMREYDKEGNLVQVTPFKGNIIHGTVIKYTDKSTIQMNYKKGVLIWEKTIHKAPKRRGMFQIL